MSREKREIIYSVIILLMVPALLVVNTSVIVSSVRRIYDEDIRLKADMANTVIAETLRQSITDKDYEEIENKLADIQKQAPELVRLSVYGEQESVIVSLAKTPDTPEKISGSISMMIKMVIERRQPIAKYESIETDKGVIKVWTVSTPLIDESTNKVLAVVNSGLNVADSQELIDKVMQQAAIVTIIGIVIVMALLFRYLRFVEYARLLARQKEINQTMSDFLSVATHELKSPTTIIKGYISNAMEDPENPLSQDTKVQLAVALAQTDRLNNLVQDLLNVSRIEQGRVEYRLQPVAISEVINLILNNYKMIAKSKNILIKYEPDPSLVVYADAGRVQEIFTNLIDNAIKYSKQGEVTISHSVKDNYIATSVRDTGIGMSAENRKRLFQRFYRIQSEQTKNISGTGLGLWIIKQYIENMGGSIEVDSMPGVGSLFSVVLPKAR